MRTYKIMGNKKYFVENRSEGNKTKVQAPNPPLNRFLSPLRYPGGRSKYLSFLHEQVDPSKTVLVETCAGGASFGLAMLDAGKIESLVLNDIDPNLAAFWDVATHDPDLYLCQMLSKNPLPTHKDFYEAKAVLREPMKQSKKSRMAHAWAYLLVNRLAFSGNMMAGPISGATGTDEAMRNRWDAEKLKNQLLHIHSLGSKIKVSNEDVKDVLDAYKLRLGNHATIFIDPPMLDRRHRTYQHEMTVEQHEALATAIENYNGRADIILLMNDDPEILKAYNNLKDGMTTIGKFSFARNRK